MLKFKSRKERRMTGDIILKPSSMKALRLDGSKALGHGGIKALGHDGIKA